MINNSETMWLNKLSNRDLKISLNGLMPTNNLQMSQKTEMIIFRQKKEKYGLQS